MDYLTVKEVAELKGCSERYIQRIVQNGKLEAIQELNPDNNCMQYKIPVSALPEEIQLRYYNSIRKSEAAPPQIKESPQTKKQHKNTVKRSFEEYSQAERDEITRWVTILEEWQALRSQYKRKTEFDPMYCSKIKIEQPDISISKDILYRKYAAYKADDLDGLLDNRGGWNRGKSSIDSRVWRAFLWYYLDDREPTIAECYRNVLDWTEEFYPDLLSTMPTLRTFRRHIESDIELYVKTYKRKGEKALLDRCAPYTERLYDNMNANDNWVADNHTLDVISFDGSTTHRLYLTAFLDVKSGVITGFNITENPSSQSTLIALRMGIKRFGIPKTVYLDNGSEFTATDVAGRGYHTKKKSKDEPLPPNVFKRLGISVQFAQVCNADAKIVERTFRTLKEQFSRAMRTFCGGKITERPESLKRIIKDGKQVPTDSIVREQLSAWIDGDYNIQPYCGREQRYEGMSRIDVWNMSIKDVGIRLAGEAELNLMLMRSTRYQKVKRNGVYINVGGEKIWFYNKEETCHYLEKNVFVRYDPFDFTQARIYDEDDRYISTWHNNNPLLCDYLEDIKDKVRDAEEYKRAVVKFMKKSSNDLIDELPEEQRITAIDMKIRKAYERSKEFKIELPSKIIPIRANEEEAFPAAVNSDTLPVTIDYRRINQNLLQRKENDNG